MLQKNVITPNNILKMPRSVNSIKKKTFSLEHNDIFQVTSLEIIHNIYSVLKDQTDFSPNNQIVNASLTQLVEHLMNWQGGNRRTFKLIENDLDDILHNLPKLCAKAEFEMELWWAEHLLSDVKTVSDFWYLPHYQALVTGEVAVLNASDHERLVFLGCGPLPLSAILLAQNHSKKNIIAIDSDETAFNLAKKLVHKNNLQSHIQVKWSRAEDFCYQSNDIVICASLLKMNGLYEKLYEQKVQKLLIRDVEYFYRLLYSPASLPPKTLYHEIKCTTDAAHRINISRVFEKIAL